MRLPGREDTIAALATAPGRAAIGIVRISGVEAGPILRNVCGVLPEARRATVLDFTDPATNTALDRGIALYFPAPHSFTGEDVAELHAHGGPVLLDLLLRTVLALGARLARPGEFSERAYLNGKLDLVQAEAIADLIESASEQAARNAVRSLQGAFSERIAELTRRLVDLRAFVEASIDFPEEELDFLSDPAVAAELRALLHLVEQIRHTARQGTLLRDGLTIVLAGKPNAGKSSVMNLLAGRETAIVSPVPGTTRDVLREYITLDQLPLHLVDTAGLHDSADELEREGMRRALAEVGRADRLLLIVDSSQDDDPQSLVVEHFSDLAVPPITIVLNKCDLSGIQPGLQVAESPTPMIAMSATTRAGFDALRAHLKQAVGYAAEGGGFSARRRHLDALERSALALRLGNDCLEQTAAGELLAEHLREAHHALGEITGEFTTEELLGEIFHRFCIGK